MTIGSRIKAGRPVGWNPLGNALGITGAGERQTVARERRLTAAAAATLLPLPLPTREADAITAQLLGIIAKANAHEVGQLRRADFNSELLWRSLDPSMRAGLASALHRLVAAGMLRRRAHNEYSVTEIAAIVSREA